MDINHVVTLRNIPEGHRHTVYNVPVRTEVRLILFMHSVLSFIHNYFVFRMRRTLANRRNIVIRPMPLFCSYREKRAHWLVKYHWVRWAKWKFIFTSTEYIGAWFRLLKSKFFIPAGNRTHTLPDSCSRRSINENWRGHPTDAQCVRVRMYDGNVGYFTVVISQSDSFLTPLQAPCCFATLHTSQWRLITLADWPLNYAAGYSSKVGLLSR